ncbi:MAG: PAS domain-containing protein [Planctomycetes bacterium]|nr:PAS domain-containing protein [Planctomycetota bacterium]
MNPHNRARRSRASGEVVRLRELLTEAQATLHAIRKGRVDAVVVQSARGPKVYTLDGAEFDYRILIESMNEGALVLTRGALILYANAHFARMLGRPLARIMGSSLHDLLASDDQAALRRLLRLPDGAGATAEVLLNRPRGVPLPVRISIRPLPGEQRKSVSFGAVVSDLTENRGREDLLRSFSRSLLQMQETVSRQIATDLGDNIAQVFCTILVRCQLLANRVPPGESRFREEALEFVHLLRATTGEVHRISTQLRPHGLEVLGLASALRGVAAEFAERMGISIRVQCARQSLHLPAATELALYRVLQEALRNVEQHSNARSVQVSLKRRAALVQLAIEDDGIGFDPDAQRVRGLREGRFGLLSMQERASAVGGSLLVKSAGKAGTQVRMCVPLQAFPGTGG